MSLYIPPINPRHKLVQKAVAEGKSIETLIKEALQKAGTVSGAARVLEVNAGTVRYHMKRLGLAVEKVIQGRVTQVGAGA
jgi:transcriptional regulator with GAF, ATPase, and Fis domain